jgi:hypothetical protein
MLSITHQLHVSAQGDILLFNQPLTAGLFVGRDHISAFCSSPSTAPSYSFARPIEIESFRLAIEMGFSFETMQLRSLERHAVLKDRPVLRIVMGERIRLLLIPAGLLPNDLLPVMQEDAELGIVVSHLVALPRTYATDYATRIMIRSVPRRKPNAR